MPSYLVQAFEIRGNEVESDLDSYFRCCKPAAWHCKRLISLIHADLHDSENENCGIQLRIRT